MEEKLHDFIRITTVVGITILLAACNETTVQTSAENQPQTIIQNSMNLTQQLEFSKADLAERLGVDPDSITVAGVRKVNWRSGALGCPNSGMNYTQALVPGVLIMLEANGDGYGYHAKTNGKPFHCPPERVEKPASVQAEDLA